MDGRLTRLADAVHVLVIQLLGAVQLVVHHLNDLGVVVVEITAYDRSVQQRAEDVNQLITTQTNTDSAQNTALSLSLSLASRVLGDHSAFQYTTL